MIRSALFAAALAVALSACKKPVEPTPPPIVIAPTAEPVKQVPVAVQQLAANFTRVYFDYNASTINSETRSILNENARILQDNADIKIQVQGHADERGTTDYNLALGDRRADQVRDYLASQGVAPSRIATVSYGEERPLESGQTERAWSKNRRAEFKITYGSTSNISGTVN